MLYGLLQKGCEGILVEVFITGLPLMTLTTLCCSSLVDGLVFDVTMDVMSLFLLVHEVKV